MLANILRLIVSIVICESAGIVGSLFTTPSIPTWYASLAKPSFNPPNWLFGPVWTILFLIMGISVFLVWNKGINRSDVKIALIIFAAQLLLNILWSVLFFGYHSPFAAFVAIICLWMTILVTIVIFYRISRVSAWLLIPYILWVSFAAVLNFFIWRLNI